MSRFQTEMKADIYIEDKNKGNSSLNENLIVGSSKSIEISAIDAEVFFEEVFEPGLRIVLKSDMQGSEAKVLSRLGQKQWNQIISASIEIWATLDIVESEVETCVDKFADFTFVSWHPGKQEKLAKNELMEFWLKRDNSFRNLYLVK